ncbi:GntR family transcriptional regulator [Ornithinimicrobium sp. Y1694]|uniref:GntR family transcriptional regulator n=1 Tax=Ornithinimicrobium sp. Y1694 TaxID=3418590 RepID=UPI003CFB5A73
MLVQIDESLPTPVYQQIVDQVVAAIRGGVLVPGEKLPSVRQLAADAGLAPNTVAKAYRQLEEEGHVATRGRGGTVVRGDLAPLSPGRRGAEEYVAVARRAGLDLEQAIGLVRSSW